MVVGHRVEEGTEGNWVLTEFFFELMVGDSNGANGDGLWHMDSSVSICIDKARHAQGHGVLSGATDMVAEDEISCFLVRLQYGRVNLVLENLTDGLSEIVVGTHPGHWVALFELLSQAELWDHLLFQTVGFFLYLFVEGS